MANVMKEALDRAAERNAEAEGCDAPTGLRRPQPMINPAPVVHPALLVAVGVLALVALALLLRPEPAPLVTAPTIEAAEVAPPQLAPVLAPTAEAAPAEATVEAVMEAVNCSAPRDEAERDACAARGQP